MKRKRNPDPRAGDQRVLRKFAWYPVKTEGHWVWLETVERVEGYHFCAHGLDWLLICHRLIE